MSKQKTRGQRGRAKATIDLIATCSEIIKQVQPITVRGVCYKLFVEGLIDSMKINNTQKISRLLVWAREQGVIPWDWIVDESRQAEGGGGFVDLAEYGRFMEIAYRRDFWAHQSCRVMVISEKSTVAGILRPVLEEYGVPFCAVHGWNSATKVHELAAEIARDRRQFVLLYVGDFDCSGMRMSEQDLPKRLQSYGAGDFYFKRIALVKPDLSGLKSFDAKKTDPRYRWFVDNYGDDAWELDAMDPNDLRDRLRDEIERYINPADWQAHKQIEEAQRQTTKQIAEAMRQAT